MNSEILYQQSRCIAHEIKNHLSICDLYSEIIKKRLDNAGFHDATIENALNCIKKSIKIMNNSLLDLKSLNNFKPENIDMAATLQQAVQMAQIYEYDKNIKIETDFKDNAIVYLDETKFLACIVNIIKNAIEAIDKKGKIKITLAIIDNFACIQISNNGTPISKEKQNEIFKEGFTTKKTGSGLGLHICEENLKAQNAKLKLLKSDKKETVFEIKISLLKES